MSAADDLEGMTGKHRPTQLCLCLRWHAIPDILEEMGCERMTQAGQSRAGVCV